MNKNKQVSHCKQETFTNPSAPSNIACVASVSSRSSSRKLGQEQKYPPARSTRGDV